MSRPILFTGFAISGSLTLGHYCGLINYILSVQEDYEVIIMLADLHGLTIPKSDFNYHQECNNLIALLCACGLQKCHFFIQSQISEHLELFWLLSSCALMGNLRNMIQYKEKKNKNDNLALFSYPVLMAADILLYDADLVVVGEDQKQHLELTAKIIKKFNRLVRCSDMLRTPNFIYSYPGSKIMSLRHPTKKMSKSINDSLFLLDTLDDIKKKVMSAETDSQNKIFYDVETKPGISNLLLIYSIFSGKNINVLEKEFVNTNYADFKKKLIFLLNERIDIIKKEYVNYLNITNDILSRDYI